jgi:3-oxoacyl-[acyl-carrier protein] reductase
VTIMTEIQGSVVAITGATAGIGRATARALAAKGASVVLGARRTERLAGMTAELGPDTAAVVEMDVRDPAGSERLVRTALERFGKLDGLVANAGIGVYGGILDATDDQVRAMVDTNVTGTVWPIRAAVPALLESQGDIVIVASVAGLRGAGDEAVYAATKFAQVGLAGALDRELRGKGVRVSTVCPGGVATEFAMGTGRTPDMPGLDDMLRAEDVADAIVYSLQQPKSMRSLVWSMRSIHEED